MKADSEISDADIANSNLVLWGDPESNAVWKKIADKLPIRGTPTPFRSATAPTPPITTP